MWTKCPSSRPHACHGWPQIFWSWALGPRLRPGTPGGPGSPSKSPSFCVSLFVGTSCHPTCKVTSKEAQTVVVALKIHPGHTMALIFFLLHTLLLTQFSILERIHTILLQWEGKFGESSHTHSLFFACTQVLSTSVGTVLGYVNTHKAYMVV